MTDETRVVLVKPGDVLLIGGVDTGAMTARNVAEASAAMHKLTGIPIVVFAADISIDSLTPDDVKRIAQRSGLYERTDTP